MSSAVRPASGADRVRGASTSVVSMQLVEPKRFEPVESPMPEPGAGCVLVRIDGCGVCGSNLPVWEGRPWFEYPLESGVPGHEGWGQIVEVGEGVEDWRPGDRVMLLSQRAFATHEVVAADQMVAIPEGLEHTDLPGEPLACAVNVMRRSGIKRGDTVAVVGTGFLGALLVQLATKAGATVLAFSRREFSREVGLRMGAEQAWPLGDCGGMADAVRELAAGELCDVVIEAGGSQQTLEVASRLVRTRGRLLVAGFHQDGPRQVDMQHWNWNGLDVINAHERDPAEYLRGMREAAALVASGGLDPRPLFTHILPLEEINDAMKLLQERPEGFVKAIVR